MPIRQDKSWLELFRESDPRPKEDGETQLLALYAAINQRPTLEGTEKQITWATKIREQLAKQLKATIAAELYKVRSQNKDVEKRKRFLSNRYTSAATLTFGTTWSAQWIGWRNLDLEEVLRRVRKSRDFDRGMTSLAASDSFKEKLHGHDL